MSLADGNATRATAYPPAILVAGLLWVFVGVSVIAEFVYLLVATVADENTWDPRRITARAIASLVGGLFRLAVGGFFLHEAVAVFRGTIPSTVGLATGSVLFAAVFVGMALFLVQDDHLIRRVIPCLAAAVLLAAGALALMGRRNYEAWWKAKSREASSAQS